MGLHNSRKGEKPVLTSFRLVKPKHTSFFAVYGDVHVKKTSQFRPLPIIYGYQKLLKQEQLQGYGPTAVNLKLY
ncbi:MAG: hypothetical protein H7228_06290 [Polaromonas sp.]|nr:hypothetical protein [Polaromonas sp.]